MSWWQKINETIEVGDELFTPGRGMEGNRRSPFWIIAKNEDGIVIKSGKSFVTIERDCFVAIERALKGQRFSQLRVASLRDNEALENSADQLVREETGSNLSRGNYVCAILEKTGLVRYTMIGNRKFIESNLNEKTDFQKNIMNYKVSIIIEKDNHGYYAFSPELEGCQSQGDSLEEVLANIREAVELYLETLPEGEIKTFLSREILTTSLEVRVG